MNYGFSPGRISVGLVVVIIQMLMYVNASAVFPAEYVDSAKSMILLYAIMTFAFTTVTGVLPSDIKRPFIGEMMLFFATFFLFAGFMYVLPFQTGAHMFQIIPGSLAIALPFMLLFAFVVGYTEELIFRGTLPAFLGDVVSNVLFGVFHLFAYSGNIWSILIAIAFGFGFAFTRDQFGLMGAVGMHTAWNLKILGAF